MIRKTY